MDYLSSAIQNLSPKENALLLQKIKTQKIKYQLFSELSKQPDIDNKNLATVLNYTDGLTNLYTLKNRLLDDIISVKIELSKNEVVKVKEKIQNLRLLVYSKDRFSLIRELRKLEKICIQLELFNELKEVYFCFFLTYRHDNKKSALYLKIMESIEEKQLLTNKLEEIFYSTVLDCQDLFYLPNKFAYDRVAEQLVKITDIHRKLNNKTSAFFYLSGELTLKLSSFYNPLYKDEIQKELQQLFKTYNHSFLIYKYPNCDVAIQCLYSRYYYLNGEEDKFNQVHKGILEKVLKVKGYQMFDCSFFYFIYVTVLTYTEKDQYERASLFIEEMISEDYVSLVSTRLRNHYLYLLAVKEFYNQNYDKSSSLLLRSRSMFNNLNTLSGWVGIENVLLNILNYIYTNDFKLIESEIGLFKRLTRKFHFEKEYHTHFNAFFRAIKQYEGGDKSRDEIIRQINMLKKQFNIYRLINTETEQHVMA